MANDENLKPFKKGVDKRRNLGGRPKGALSVKTRLRNLLEAYEAGEEVDNLDAMLISLIKRVKEKGDAHAFDKLIDRLEGKPKQTIEGDVDNHIIVEVVE